MSSYSADRPRIWSLPDAARADFVDVHEGGFRVCQFDEWRRRMGPQLLSDIKPTLPVAQLGPAAKVYVTKGVWLPQEGEAVEDMDAFLRQYATAIVVQETSRDRLAYARAASRIPVGWRFRTTNRDLKAAFTTNERLPTSSDLDIIFAGGESSSLDKDEAAELDSELPENIGLYLLVQTNLPESEYAEAKKENKQADVDAWYARQRRHTFEERCACAKIRCLCPLDNKIRTLVLCCLVPRSPEVARFKSKDQGSRLEGSGLCAFCQFLSQAPFAVNYFWDVSALNRLVPKGAKLDHASTISTASPYYRALMAQVDMTVEPPATEAAIDHQAMLIMRNAWRVLNEQSSEADIDGQIESEQVKAELEETALGPGGIDAAIRAYDDAPLYSI